jgi:hypothetical protein
MSLVLKQLARYATYTQGVLSGEQGYIEPRLQVTDAKAVTFVQALRKSQRLLIMGQPGTGKSTLLRHEVAAMGRKYLEDPSLTAAPVWLRASRLSLTPDGISALIAERVSEAGAELPGNPVEELLQNGNIFVFLDGLDESSDLTLASVRLENFLLQFPKVGFVVSTRPHLSLDRASSLVRCKILEWDDGQVKKAIDHLPDRDMRSHFRKEVFGNKAVRKLASNPLLLTLLWAVFVQNRRVPLSRGAILEHSVEAILSRWDAKKTGGATKFTLAQLLDILEQLALHALATGRYRFDRQFLLAFIKGVGPTIPVDDAIGELTYNPIFSEIGPDAFAFVHKSLLEFFGSRALRFNPNAALATLGADVSIEVINISKDLISDVDAIVKAAVSRKLFHVAAQFMSNRRVDRALSSYVLEEFKREFGDEFVKLIRVKVDDNDGVSETSKTNSASLLEMYYSSRNLRLTNSLRGKAFETFAESFFGNTFKIVSRDLRTEYGEIDLVVEMAESSPFWAEYGNHALVECKNWSSGTPLSEVGAFLNKAMSTRVQLAFFVSASGFTSDAMNILKLNSANPAKPLVVPIAGETIVDALTSETELDELFRRSVRQIKFLHKF